MQLSSCRRVQFLLPCGLLLLLTAITSTRTAAAQSNKVLIVKLAATPSALVAHRAGHVGRARLRAMASAEAQIQQQQQTFHAHAWRAGLRYSTRRQFATVFNGVSISVSADSAVATAAALRALPGVVAVSEARQYKRPQAYSTHVVRTFEPKDLFANIMTGAVLVQQTLGYNGTGVRIGIIDTGVDYTHPDLGGCFGPGCRVAYGYDFVGDTFDGYENQVPGPDPLDQCDGHGTHVAGVAAASGAVMGVAPGATLGAYRVFGCFGGTTDDILIAALNQAANDSMQIINLSLGSDYDYVSPTDPIIDVYNNLEALNIVVTAAAGNSGGLGQGLGLFAVNDPGTLPAVLSTASVDNSPVYISGLTMDPGGRAIGYANLSGVPWFPYGTPLQVVVANLPNAVMYSQGPENDACTPDLVSDAVAGNIALVMTGHGPINCTLSNKIASAQAKGAVGVLLYNSENVTTYFTSTIVGVTIPACDILRSDALAMRDAIAAGPVTLTFTYLPIFGTVPNPTGGHVSYFSSMGPKTTLDMKPDIAAPGANILSTWPVPLGSYAIVSGTSASAPHIAGAAALLLSAIPGTSAYNLRTSLLNTAIPALDAQFPGATAAANLQGAGVLNIYNAITAPIAITPPKLALNASMGANYDPSALSPVITVYNGGSTLVAFDISHQAAVAQLWSDNIAQSGAEAVWDADASFSLNGNAISVIQVPPGTAAQFQVAFTPPGAAPAFTIYSGYIILTPADSSSTQIYRVPYMGMAGDYQQLVPVNLDFGHVDADPTTQVDVTLDYTQSYVTLSGENNWQFKFFDVANHYPAYMATFRHVVRMIQCRVYQQPSGMYLYSLFPLTYVSGGNTMMPPFIITGDPSSSSPNSDPNSDPTNPVTCSLPEGLYSAQIVVVRVLAAFPDPRTEEILRSNWFTIKRSGVPNYELCSISADGIHFPSIYNVSM